MRKMLKKLAMFLGLGVAVLAVGCSGSSGGGGGDKGYVDTGVYYPYAGTYVTTVEMTFTDNDGADEYDTWGMDMLLEQNGPALTMAGILALGGEEGLSFGHTVTGFDPFFGSAYTQTYSGSSLSGDPLTVELVVDGAYTDMDYSWTYDYTVVLGEKLTF